MSPKRLDQLFKDIYFLDCRYYYNVLKDYAVPMTHQVIDPHTNETIEYFNFLKKAERKIAENYKKWVLPLALGYTKKKEVYITDLSTQPHLLVAGQSGSGKSTGLQNMLISLFSWCHPEYLDIYLIDFKGLTFYKYKKIVKLTETQKGAEKNLQELVDYMEAVYKKLKITGFENITEYNEKIGFRKKGSIPFKHKVVVIDEFAELVIDGEGEGYTSLIRLAQKGRAAGIHLVLATQRPDADILKGIIKANVPARAVYKMINLCNSNIALGTSGTEKLRLKGEFCWLSSSIHEGESLYEVLQTPNVPRSCSIASAENCQRLKKFFTPKKG